MANPLQQASVRRKAYYVAAIIGLFTLSILWRGDKESFAVPLSNPDRSAYLNKLRRLGPDERKRVEDQLARGQVVEGFEAPPPAATTGVNAGADWLQSRTIAAQASPDALDLRELDQGDAEIAGATARLSLIGARGFVVTALWKLAIDKQKKNEFQDFEMLVRAVTRLQPNFITPWIYQSWNIAYNVSVENDRLNDMFFYIARGIELLAEGERLNKNSPDMRFQIAFYYQNKFSVSDKVTTLRSLMQLACIRPEDRDPKRRFRKPDGTLDLAQFQEFARKNPQLVRRLKESKLNLRRPEEIVQFLEDNYRVPGRFDRETGQLAKPEAQFPVLPRQFPEGPEEFHPRSDGIDDSFDAFHAARAWYTYAQTVVPPPNPEPTGIVHLTGEERFKYRIPRSPALIIFRQHPARAQTYLADRLTKEGWFGVDPADPRDLTKTTVWYPDERADTDEERWFPRPSAADAGPGEGLRAGAAAVTEWQLAYARWKRHGELNGLDLSLPKLTEYDRLAQGVSDDPSLEERTDEQLGRLGLTRARIRARQILRNYYQNRSMTNFAYFLASSEAESDRDTVAARALLWEAERMVAVSKPRAIELYAEAIAKWRGVLLAHPRFHHPDGASRSDLTEEQTYEQMLALIGLLEKGERVETKARQRLEAIRAVTPVAAGQGTDDRLRAAVARDVAELEAGVLVSAADEQVKRRVAGLNTLPATVKPGTMAYFDHPAVREVVANEFGWLAEYKTRQLWEARNETGRWVSPETKMMVRDRLGLARGEVPQGATPQGMVPPHAAQRGMPGTGP